MAVTPLELRAALAAGATALDALGETLEELARERHDDLAAQRARRSREHAAVLRAVVD